MCHLRGLGAPVHDARPKEVLPLAAWPLPDAVRRVLGALDPAAGADDVLMAAVVAEAARFEHQRVP